MDAVGALNGPNIFPNTRQQVSYGLLLFFVGADANVYFKNVTPSQYLIISNIIRLVCFYFSHILVLPICN